MKYFLLIAGDNYYPAGLEDWIGTFETYEEATSRVKKNNNRLRSFQEWIILDKTIKK